MSMPRVFLPQVVERYDSATGRRVSFDFSPAAQFGQLTEVLSSDDNPLFLAHLTQKIREVLEDFNENDYLLAVGDPAVIAACAGVLFRRQTKVKMLKWDRKMKVYIALEINP